MKLYHGSMLEVRQPSIALSRKHLDFGQGFYTTPIEQQAIDWAKRFKRLKKPAVVNSYEFDDALLSQYRTKQFDAYNEDWLDFIIANRTAQPVAPYDIIVGGVANDRVFNTIELLLENLISQQEALGRLIYEANNLQICFREQSIIDSHLIFTGSNTL